ncbi:MULTISPECIES: GNAT family N-acetyltransferase [Cytobacillus]|uniref:GNAT family N-acetyltransferase n=1 Tax=Cytobacillus TaxID=2675230 RepID=UPI0020420250|nr:GNAT family N-acetyltransferase [Cytobacillus firmus]MCM3706865.1 GNAT family N-acetyltransferase [Cytobacillus firmus]
MQPWLACLYIDPACRGKKLGAILLDHGIEEAAKLGFKKLYLQTDLEGYYEKYGWVHRGKVFGASGNSIPFYERLFSQSLLLFILYLLS